MHLPQSNDNEKERPPHCTPILGGAGGGGELSNGGSSNSSESGTNRTRNSGRGGREGGGGGGDDDPDDERSWRNGGHHNEDGPPWGGPPGPPGPPDDGGNGGEESGDSEKSNHTSNRNTQRQRGATPFNVIPEENAPYYKVEYFEYSPESQDRSIPLKERVFNMFETLIDWRLFTKLEGVGDGKAQKNLINSIPKINPYKGENSIIVLEQFTRQLIRHMEIQGLTGPPKTKDGDGHSVVTNEDTGRTILFAGNLQDAAQAWYQKVAERPPKGYKRGMKASMYRRTFLQIFRALYERFITGSALNEIETLYEDTKYTTNGGVRQLFADMKMYAEIMPVPPDEFRFKNKFIGSLPRRMRMKVLENGVSAAKSTLDDIVQRALNIELGWEANAYYDVPMKVKMGGGITPENG
ncbi:hypothetical protein VKT23_000945 [Stygiomarasmius scandens]|uniref:Uncharacterized protein n=1 Tax=Marasmiellus scandens TaxID=2682957 RepID=A0ABR1K5X4_9AGAR